MGLMKRSYLGGFLVKPSPTKQTFVTILFQAFFCLFPVLMTFSTSVSPWARTFGKGTSHFPCTQHPMFVFSKPVLSPHCWVNPMNQTTNSWHLQPSLSSSVWSCWKELLHEIVPLCPTGKLELHLEEFCHHSSAWYFSVRAFWCYKQVRFCSYEYGALNKTAKITKCFFLHTHVFFIWIFSAYLCLWYSLAFKPIIFLALWERSWASLLSFFLFFSWWSRR